MLQGVWADVLNDLEKTVGKNSFSSWIKPLILSNFESGIATFHVPTAFIGNYVEQNFGDLLKYYLSQKELKVQRLKFKVAAPHTASAPHTQRSEETSTSLSTGSHIKTAKHGSQNRAAYDKSPAFSKQEKLMTSGAPKNIERFTFENFVVGNSNELAYAASRRMSEGAESGFNLLYIYGGVGLGKTHLLHAIHNQLTQAQNDLNVTYLSAEQFMYRFISALREKKMIDFKAQFRSSDVLMIDDIQFIAGKGSTQEEFFHTFNALIDSGKTIILTADRAPGSIKGLEERLQSRLQCGLTVDLKPTDDTLRLGILHRKAEHYKALYPNVEIEDGVLSFLSERIDSNTRVLEGALTRLFAFASLVSRPVSLALAQDCLADIFKTVERKISIEDIQKCVAEHYEISLSDMIGPRRLRTVARPRQMAMYLAKILTRRSLPEIGRRFGGRDHTTVIHGVKKIEALLQSDTQFSEDLDHLRRALTQ